MSLRNTFSCNALIAVLISHGNRRSNIIKIIIRLYRHEIHIEHQHCPLPKMRMSSLTKSYSNSRQNGILNKIITAKDTTQTLPSPTPRPIMTLPQKTSLQPPPVISPTPPTLTCIPQSLGVVVVGGSRGGESSDGCDGWIL